ncbi:MAG: AAA family ATPase [Alphaproteobacteria bacterium]|nr:AAA family ATPase [Alphaproteobacteria bacterium]
MAIYHHTTRMIGRSNGGNPVKAIAYISGIQITDPNTGEVFDFQDKSVQDVRILLPENAPAWAKEIQQLVATDREKGIQLLSDMANAAEKRVDAQVYREIEFSLPRELTYEQRKTLAQEYVQDQFCSLGMLAIQGFHEETCEKTGEPNPHCHTFFLTRELVEDGLASKKNRDWNTREIHEVWREQWAQYASFHLKMYGFDITLDHRSYKDQGLDIEPQIKLGKGVNEQEKRAEGIEGRSSSKTQENSPENEKDIGGFVEATPATKRTQAFREVQLRNLYRIMRRPETVLDIVTRHHATFMWGDVQKILGRYVDDSTLFQRLDARLQNSKELLLLKGNKENKDEAIYTTHIMLKAEKKLVGTAESLARHDSHTVSSASIEGGLERLKTGLNQKGHALSEGQEQAIRHLVNDGQLKCIVGYAGAGKTTALEVCRDIWEDAGYRVYGLAPTGRAAQNLEGSGIKSQTLHKFLKSFNEGRCQYNERSILVLDEAGMVDVERFDKFLGAVQTLGVKAVVVGDGAQLQPVEAGPAFRLVTERVGVSRLEEIVRQKEDWQKEATVLFGQQESQKAIQAYQDKGHVHLIEEHPTTDVISRYEMAARTSGLIFREIMQEVKELSLASKHEDYGLFLHWKNIQRTAGKEILDNPEMYKPVLESRNIDPLEMARLFVNKKQNKKLQYDEAASLLKDKGLGHLIGLEKPPGQTVEVRGGAKAALIEDWKKTFQEDPDKSLLMMAYSNRDVRNLNAGARTHLKEVGILDKKDFAYTIHREVEDDFGRKKIFKEERVFSKGDKLVFTRNNTGLGVKNGTIGTITDISAQKIEVKVMEDQKVSFAPKLNPYFDQGWAVTIHKSQGTTVDKSFLLASHEMTQNLTYVAMTRHRDSVQVYGSTLDFWRDKKLPQVLSKSGEKLGAADYLDAISLAKLMKEEDRFLTKLFTRLGDELHAMGAVSKQVFKNVADHFLGRTSEKSILLKPETIREETRAHEILQKESVRSFHPTSPAEINAVQDVHEDMKHPAFQEADFYKRVFTKGLKTQGEAASIEYWKEKREPYVKQFNQKMENVNQLLASPLLGYMSDKSKDLARKAAFEDPDKAIKFLGDLKDIKQAEHDAHAQALQAKEAAFKEQAQQEQRRQEALKKGLSHYYRFKDLSHELEKQYDSDLEKECSDLSKSLYKNKEVYEHIKQIDPEMSQAIKQLAQEKQLQQKIKEMDRGGMSL